MNTQSIVSRGLFAMVVIGLLLLPGCKLLDWFKKKKDKGEAVITTSPQFSLPSGDTSTVVMSIDGKPVLTENMFRSYMQEFLEKNQQLKALANFMPDFEERFFDSQVSQIVIDKFIYDEGIDQSDEYKQELKQAIDLYKKLLNSQFFSKRFTGDVTDAEVRKFYEENKAAEPRLLISRGGIKTVGVQFDKESEAKAFLEKVKGKSSAFDQIAKDSGLTSKVRDFKLVNNQSLGIDASLRDKIMAIKHFPTVELIKINDSSYWVVNAINSEEPKYQPFDQVKEQLKAHLEKEKQMEKMEKEIDKLKNEYKVEINKSILKKQTPQSEQKVEELNDFMQPEPQEMQPTAQAV